jgi:hypothetical protein
MISTVNVDRLQQRLNVECLHEIARTVIELRTAFTQRTVDHQLRGSERHSKQDDHCEKLSLAARARGAAVSNLCTSQNGFHKFRCSMQHVDLAQYRPTKKMEFKSICTKCWWLAILALAKRGERGRRSRVSKWHSSRGDSCEASVHVDARSTALYVAAATIVLKI